MLTCKCIWTSLPYKYTILESQLSSLELARWVLVDETLSSGAELDPTCRVRLREEDLSAPFKLPAPHVPIRATRIGKGLAERHVKRLRPDGL